MGWGLCWGAGWVVVGCVVLLDQMIYNIQDVLFFTKVSRSYQSHHWPNFYLLLDTPFFRMNFSPPPSSPPRSPPRPPVKRSKKKKISAANDKFPAAKECLEKRLLAVATTVRPKTTATAVKEANRLANSLGQATGYTPKVQVMELSLTDILNEIKATKTNNKRERQQHPDGEHDDVNEKRQKVEAAAGSAKSGEESTQPSHSEDEKDEKDEKDE